MVKAFYLFFFVFYIIQSNEAQKKYTYESVPNDPLKARIYTLNNGLKIYLTVNKATPRIKALIAVRAGGKNDPSETTGLAHYFEHLMFKGTQKYGTLNYELEEPFLNHIEKLFEIYRHTQDEIKRIHIYHQIDSLSHLASQYAIPNEYDKLMTFIGSKGSNAYTSYDETVYLEDIPANQIENWAKIQADRFENIVIRNFHTELETVYEEKNMSLTNDYNKVFDAALSELFPHHPYGTQTILGTQEELKNPSITNIKKFYKTWYVPNNMAVCLSGDLNPEETVVIIDKYFGSLKPNLSLPILNKRKETPICSPIKKDIFGGEAESLILAWRFPGVGSPEFKTLRFLSKILSNDHTGLMDVNLNQAQKVLGAYCYPIGFADYSVFFIEARPKEGQTLDELKDLLLKQVNALRSGTFDEEVLVANINNFKLAEMKKLEKNDERANKMLNSFIYNTPWEEEVNTFTQMSHLTKDEITAFARYWLKDNNYAAIYKRQGKNLNEKSISKPEITPLITNRDATSLFFKEIQESFVRPINPVFLNFDKDLDKMTVKNGIPFIYKKNVNNDIFQLVYVFEMGKCHDKALDIAFQYLDYLGTPTLSSSALKNEFYKMACDFTVNPGMERTSIVLSGLNENLPHALECFENLMANAIVNKDAYFNMIEDIIKIRKDDKLDQMTNFIRLLNYAIYGPHSPITNILSEEELRNTDPQQLVNRIHNQNNFKHRILYYGPSSSKEVIALINKYHTTPDTLLDIPVNYKYPRLLTSQTKVYLAPYDAKQIYMAQYSNRGDRFDPRIEPLREMYNEYFSGNMSSIVFQELRERRGLAYFASAGIMQPTFLKYPYTMRSQIVTQNDKMLDAIHTFNNIINTMPESENTFKLAQEGLINRLRTERIVESEVLWTYINSLDLGFEVDPRIQVYQRVQNMNLRDLVEYQKEWVKGRTFVYCILGNKNELNMDELREIGLVEELTQEEIFGYE